MDGSISYSKVQLGCGLVGIGREWGARDSEVPTEQAVFDFLGFAIENGIRFFDTAPAYGCSEERLGKFLDTLDADQRKKLFIATKCGERYDFDTKKTIVDHSIDSLRTSIEGSLSRLGAISLLQLHKSTAALLQDKEIINLFIEYRKLIPHMGVSVTDMETAQVAVASNLFDFIQFPYNIQRPELKSIFHLASVRQKQLIINRPLGTGYYLYKEGGLPMSGKEEAIQHAFSFILQESFMGIVLVGTKNIEHLAENIKIFDKALSSAS